ncbi:hypothetical protein MTO96_039298 [Rhipicephalus appendiculatus]
MMTWSSRTWKQRSPGDVDNHAVAANTGAGQHDDLLVSVLQEGASQERVLDLERVRELEWVWDSERVLDMERVRDLEWVWDSERVLDMERVRDLPRDLERIFDRNGSFCFVGGGSVRSQLACLKQ